MCVIYCVKLTDGPAEAWTANPSTANNTNMVQISVADCELTGCLRNNDFILRTLENETGDMKLSHSIYIYIKSTAGQHWYSQWYNVES